MNKIFAGFRKLDPYTRYSILVIVLGIMIRFALAMPYHISGDACWHVSNAKFMADNLKFPLFEPLGREQPFWSPPAYHLIVAAVFSAFGIFGTATADFAIKLINPLFGSLSLIFSYLILRRLLAKEASFYGLLFITFLPVSMDYSVIAYADGVLSFFITASIYYALKNNVWVSAISLSLAVLTKYTAFFAIPAVLYIVYTKNKAAYIKEFIKIGTLMLFISSWWYVRNWVYLKNPVYPLFNSLFGGIQSGATYSGLHFSNLASLNPVIFPYLEIFGVPNGNPANIFFFNVPLLPLLLGIWLAATVIFILPIFFGFNLNKEARNIGIVLFAPFLLAAMLHTLNVNSSFIGRRMLPAIIVLAILWGNGTYSLAKKIGNEKLRKFLFFVFILIIAGFVFVEAVKIVSAAGYWNFYADDFSWVRSNTPEDAIFMVGGQCMSYYLDRFTLLPQMGNIERADYVFMNQDFKVDKKRVKTPEDVLEGIKENSKLVYDNKETKTQIYSVKG